MPKHKWESGISQPFRYGISRKFELHSNALEAFVFPNVGCKIAQGEKNGFVFASDHELSYPTRFMKFVSIKGTGGLISPQFQIPEIISISNSFIVTKYVSPSSVLSAVIGFSFAIRSVKPDPLATIDLPLVYPRMAHYYSGSTIRSGLIYKGRLCKKLFFEESVQVFYITRSNNNFFFENRGAFMLALGKSIRIKGGYSLSNGTYPYGTMWQLWPALDFIFGSKVPQ
jgi:hypothetical protein